MKAFKQQFNVLGKANITFHDKRLVIGHSFMVIEDLFPCLLIKDNFLRKNHAVIN